MLVQVRDVPDEAVARLKARAAEEGITLTALLRAELVRLAYRPSKAEVLDRIDRERPRKGPSSADIVAEIRKIRESS